MDERGEYLTVAEAAQRFGISKEAVRKRISRGTLQVGRDEDERVTVYVPPSGTSSGTESHADHELVEAKEETIRVLQQQLEAEREARLRADHIIARLSESNAELSRTVRELESGEPEQPPASEHREPSEEGGRSGSEAEQGAGAAPESQTLSQRLRRWWRRS